MLHSVLSGFTTLELTAIATVAMKLLEQHSM